MTRKRTRLPCWHGTGVNHVGINSKEFLGKLQLIARLSETQLKKIESLFNDTVNTNYRCFYGISTETLQVLNPFLNKTEAIILLEMAAREDRNNYVKTTRGITQDILVKFTNSDTIPKLFDSALSNYLITVYGYEFVDYLFDDLNSLILDIYKYLIPRDHELIELYNWYINDQNIDFEGTSLYDLKYEIDLRFNTSFELVDKVHTLIKEGVLEPESVTTTNLVNQINTFLIRRFDLTSIDLLNLWSKNVI